jgi:hypothetical protein
MSWITDKEYAHTSVDGGGGAAYMLPDTELLYCLSRGRVDSIIARLGKPCTHSQCSALKNRLSPSAPSRQGNHFSCVWYHVAAALSIIHATVSTAEHRRQVGQWRCRRSLEDLPPEGAPCPAVRHQEERWMLMRAGARSSSMSGASSRAGGCCASSRSSRGGQQIRPSLMWRCVGALHEAVEALEFARIMLSGGRATC